MSGGSGNDDDKRVAHMKQRRKHGLTFKALGDEFDTSKSSAHRKARETKPKQKLDLRKGVIDMGSAK